MESFYDYPDSDVYHKNFAECLVMIKSYVDLHLSSIIHKHTFYEKLATYIIKMNTYGSIPIQIKQKTVAVRTPDRLKRRMIRFNTSPSKREPEPLRTIYTFDMISPRVITSYILPHVIICFINGMSSNERIGVTISDDFEEFCLNYSLVCGVRGYHNNEKINKHILFGRFKRDVTRHTWFIFRSIELIEFANKPTFSICMNQVIYLSFYGTAFTQLKIPIMEKLRGISIKSSDIGLQVLLNNPLITHVIFQGSDISPYLHNKNRIKSLTIDYYDYIQLLPSSGILTQLEHLCIQNNHGPCLFPMQKLRSFTYVHSNYIPYNDILNVNLTMFVGANVLTRMKITIEIGRASCREGV